MVDNFAILVAHVAIALAIWRLIWRDDLDREPPAGGPPGPTARPPGDA